MQAGRPRGSPETLLEPQENRYVKTTRFTKACCLLLLLAAAACCCLLLVNLCKSHCFDIAVYLTFNKQINWNLLEAPGTSWGLFGPAGACRDAAGACREPAGGLQGGPEGPWRLFWNPRGGPEGPWIPFWGPRGGPEGPWRPFWDPRGGSEGPWRP